MRTVVQNVVDDGVLEQSVNPDLRLLWRCARFAVSLLESPCKHDVEEHMQLDTPDEGATPPRELTFEEFMAVPTRRHDWGLGAFVEDLEVGQPAPVPRNLTAQYKDARTSAASIAKRLYGPKRLATRTVDGTLYLCILPEEQAKS